MHRPSRLYTERKAYKIIRTRRECWTVSMEITVCRILKMPRYHKMTCSEIRKRTKIIRNINEYLPGRSLCGIEVCVEFHDEVYRNGGIYEMRMPRSAILQRFDHKHLFRNCNVVLLSL